MGSSTSEFGVGLGLTMEHSTNKIMEDHHILQQQQQQQQLLGVGCVSDLYDNNTSSKHFQHLDSFSLSPCGMAGGKVSFTAAQWQELQRQTMIYKYMMASIPVPAELLMSINIASSIINRGSLELGFPSHNSDPEPWRCRRTDGKKWRCSRDVAPDQKYCERHSHKTRPRSRKPVEVPTATQQQSLNQTATNNSSHSKKSPLQLNKDIFPSLFPTVVSASQYDPRTRCQNWYVSGEPNSSSVASPTQEWQQQMTQSKLGLKRDYLTSCNTNLGSTKNQDLRFEPLGFEYGHGRGLQAQSLSDQCSLLLGPNMSSLEDDLQSNGTQETRHFIDAWSTGESDGNKCSLSREFAVPSSLSLSMSAEANRDQGNSQFCLGTMGLERENLGDSKTHWWLGSTPGGPLAEALCLGISSNSTNPASTASSSSPYGRNNGGSSSKTSSGDGRGGLNLIN